MVFDSTQQLSGSDQDGTGNGVLGRIPGCVRQLLCTAFCTTSASSPGVTPLLLLNGCLHYHGGVVGQRLTAWCIADG